MRAGSEASALETSSRPGPQASVAATRIRRRPARGDEELAEVERVAGGADDHRAAALAGVAARAGEGDAGGPVRHLGVDERPHPARRRVGEDAVRRGGRRRGERRVRVEELHRVGEERLLPEGEERGRVARGGRRVDRQGARPRPERGREARRAEVRRGDRLDPRAPHGERLPRQTVGCEAELGVAVARVDEGRHQRVPPEGRVGQVEDAVLGIVGRLARERLAREQARARAAGERHRHAERRRKEEALSHCRSRRRTTSSRRWDRRRRTATAARRESPGSRCR